MRRPGLPSKPFLEMGSPPMGLPALVERRIENRVTGTGARTDRRSLETVRLNAYGGRQAIETRWTNTPERPGSQDRQEDWLAWSRGVVP